MMTKTEKVALALSALFVPGDRPERFLKAYNSGADIVIIDLEDAVGSEHKDAALHNAIEALTSANEGFEALVRVNKDRLAIELPALTELANSPENGLLGIMFPKVESESDIPSDLGDLAVVALIESAQGIENVSSIARAEGITRLAFGAVDFGAELESEHPVLLGYARSRIVLASAAAGLSRPLDSPSVVIKNAQLVLEQSSDSYRMGFGGKMAIHPVQLDSINTGFGPSNDEVEWAEKILESSGAAVQVDGQMVDRPVFEKAKKILARARKAN